MTEHIKFSGRILFLTEDTSLIRQQLEASDEAATTLETELAGRLLEGDLPLMSNISTDEITPGWVCFYYDETLGQYVYVGMRDAAVKKDEVKNGGFAVVVSGLSKGCGSSRETAPFAEKAAGIQLVIARTIEKIYAEALPDLVLGVDCSTTACKVVAWDRAGKAVAEGGAAESAEEAEDPALANRDIDVTPDRRYRIAR